MYSCTYCSKSLHLFPIFLAKHEAVGVGLDFFTVLIMYFNTHGIWHDWSVELKAIFSLIFMPVLSACLCVRLLQDKYLHTNCLAALANMSAQFRCLHQYAAQRIIR